MLRLSAAAQLDLFRIAFDGLDQFGPHQVAKYEAGLNKALDFLTRHPHAAAEHSEYHPPVRIHPYGVHVIVYHLDDDGIFVIRICNARED